MGPNSMEESPVQDESTCLFERFRDQFAFILAREEATRRRIFRLRYDIYCEELGYEAPAIPGQYQEHDAYDPYSLQCLIQHRQSGLSAGCMRLVLPDHAQQADLESLPLLAHCRASLTHDSLHPDRFSRHEVCEISRLAISPLFRRRSTEEEIESLVEPPYAFSAAERQTFPLIVVGLFLATYALLGLAGRPHAFAMMEPRLPRLLRMSGFHFTRVGETIDFHGKRSAFYIDQRRVEDEMQPELMPLYRYIERELATQLEGSLSRAFTPATS